MCQGQVTDKKEQKLNTERKVLNTLLYWYNKQEHKLNTEKTFSLHFLLYWNIIMYFFFTIYFFIVWYLSVLSSWY